MRCAMRAARARARLSRCARRGGGATDAMGEAAIAARVARHSARRGAARSRSGRRPPSARSSARRPCSPSWGPCCLRGGARGAGRQTEQTVRSCTQICLTSSSRADFCVNVGAALKPHDGPGWKKRPLGGGAHGTGCPGRADRVRHGPRSGDGRSATTTSPGWHAVGEMQAMSSPLADLQDSVSALHVTLRHLCRALEGNLGTWPTGDRLVAASSLQRLLETDALFSLLQDRARGAMDGRGDEAHACATKPFQKRALDPLLEL